MHSSQNSMKFAIPECTREQLTFSNPDKASIQEWIANLPKTNLGETARRLYFALQDLNGVDLPVTTRLSILEQLRPSIYYACRELSVHFLKKALTLTEKQRKIASLSQALQSHLLIGYKIVISQQLKGELDSQGKKNLVIAIHRAVTESSQTLLRCYQLYCSPPKNIWKELHTLYRLAETYNLHKAAVDDRECKGNSQKTIACSYKKALLLSRARPNMLRQQELGQLFDTLSDWSGAATLEPSVSEHSVFAINVEADTAPSYSTTVTIEDPTHYRGLDTRELTSMVDDITKSAQQELSPILLHHLLSCWRPKTERSHVRSQTSGSITFAAGLSATHFYLSGETPFHQSFPHPDQLALNTKAAFDSPSDKDIWDHVTGAVPSGNQMTAMVGDIVLFDGQEKTTQATYPLFEASLIDTSPGGYCARLRGDIPPHIQAGEIIAIRSPSGYQWMMAIIRWVRLEGAEQVVFGIQLLSPNAHPTAISIIHKKRSASDFLRCFYLPEFKELDEPAYLITPRVPFHVGSKVRFFNGKEFVTAVLAECTISTGSFSKYLFNLYVPKTTPDSEDQIVNQTQAEDEFQVLWSNL
ncbi:hypothetical protein [Parendozoicomonas haliclonae]|uniref:GTPase n=1 Tax=Parendozoicomonas haliclonae TaxID=1960125 RepID=A0A1X7APX3_9GAMM|nr:hypothetical protein [Parendozoicomonas haliclonae]SMA50148.1 hypothetical protein EHSB41UT_03939 [Parendozoicomonas haliclonae]